METKSGKPVHPIGIGTWLIAGSFEYDPTKIYRGVEPRYDAEQQEIEALQYSLAKGQNHIDCAELYGGFYTDEVVGRAITDFNREDLFIADKLWSNSVGKDLVRPTVEAMLGKLGTDYLDLLYIHHPWKEVEWWEAIPQIDKLIDEQVVRHFGVSNFMIEDMKRTTAIAEHPILANQVNYSAARKDIVDKAFLDYCRIHNVKIVAYEPIKNAFSNKTIQEIAIAHNATTPQISLAWLLDEGVLPIPKSTNKQHIDENLGALDIRLTKHERQLLNDL